MLVGYIIDQATRREKRARKNDSGIPRVLDRNDINVSRSQDAQRVLPWCVAGNYVPPVQRGCQVLRSLNPDILRSKNATGLSL